MENRHQSQENDTGTPDEWSKVAAQCCECSAVYSAWILSDDTVQPIGRKDGCRCGAEAFEAISE